MVRLLVLVSVLLAGCNAPRDPGAEADARTAAAETRSSAPPVEPGDTVLLAEALGRAAGLPNLRGVLVSQRGEIVLERYSDGAAADRPTNVKSVSKSL
ncbi:MAG TPA: hypothetical protein VFS20_01060, partial [Longimicrobium sp.]|nr:hypothetical protein [Longimicrobium sp.]